MRTVRCVILNQHPCSYKFNCLSLDDHVTDTPQVKIMTPADPEERGAQLSIKFSVPIDRVFTELTKRGVVVSSNHF